MSNPATVPRGRAGDEAPISKRVAFRGKVATICSPVEFVHAHRFKVYPVTNYFINLLAGRASKGANRPSLALKEF